jgi:hypothetical protein
MAMITRSRPAPANNTIRPAYTARTELDRVNATSRNR